MVVIISIAVSLTVNAHEGTHRETADTAVGIDERLGQRVPLDLRFLDETGKGVSLGDVITGPTVLSLAYLSCTSICPQFLAAKADVISMIPARMGTDYHALTVSFDELDTPQVAREKKENYLEIIGKDVPQDAWRFLTGNRESIRALTESMGFSFRREGQDFLHPVALIVLSGDGTIVRYIYGKRFLPFDLRMALTEASEGRVGSTVNRVLLYCFRYDPEGKSYVFDTMRVFGVSTTLAGVVFFLYLVLGGRKDGKKT